MSIRTARPLRRAHQTLRSTLRLVVTEDVILQVERLSRPLDEYSKTQQQPVHTDRKYPNLIRMNGASASANGESRKLSGRAAPLGLIWKSAAAG